MKGGVEGRVPVFLEGDKLGSRATKQHAHTESIASPIPLLSLQIQTVTPNITITLPSSGIVEYLKRNGIIRRRLKRVHGKHAISALELRFF